MFTLRTVNHGPTVVMALLAAGAQGCSRSERRESPPPNENSVSPTQISQRAPPLSLRAIRPYLTHDLTLAEAFRRFGSPRSDWQSGFLYGNWLLDDSNILATAFSLDGKRLRRALVKNPKGEVIEHVLDIPER